MSYDFFNERTVTARKQHRCDACLTPIEAGTSHSYMVGKIDGDFWMARNHVECRAAECGLADLHNLCGGVDWLFLHDLDDEDREWVAENHPAAFARLPKREAQP